MSRISVDVSSARIPVLQVGYQGENEVTDVLFDISSWITEFGEGVAQLRVKRPGNSEEESYVLSLTITDGKAVWTVSETDTANKGNGKVQLSYMVGNIVKKAVIYPYKVGKSIVGADNPVDPFDSWIERSKAWAIGETLDGDNVPETDETYQNNAKYYAEQADILGSAQVVLAAEKVTLAAEQVTLATEKADAAAASEAAVNGVSTQLTDRMSAIEAEQAVQDARMDTFTSLPEGSTSGNAELADIRVGADGTTYDTAGNAVRGQISELKSDLVDIENTYDLIVGKNLFNVSKTTTGYLNASGDVVDNNDWLLSNYVEVKTPKLIASRDDGNGNRVTSGSWFFLAQYNASKELIKYAQMPSSRIELETNTKYIRFSIQTSEVNVQIEYGEDNTSYEPYTGRYVLKSSSLPNIDSKWSGLKWTCIGDSLTAINDKTTKHYHDYISEKTGITVQNLAISGSGYAKKQDTNEAFYQRILLTDLDTDVVTIFGSFNDSSADLPYGTINDTGTDTYYGCVNKAIDNLYSILPMARLGIIAPTPWESVNPYTRTQSNYVDMLKNVCEKRGIPFLDLYHTSGLRPWEESFRQLAYSKDNGSGVHPDETGHLLFSPRIQKFLEELLLH